MRNDSFYFTLYSLIKYFSSDLDDLHQLIKELKTIFIYQFNQTDFCIKNKEKTIRKYQNLYFIDLNFYMRFDNMKVNDLVVKLNW